MKRKMEIFSSSMEIIFSNQDLLTKILLRLPVKPFFCFKSVSKQWHSLISSLQFSSTYAIHTPKPTFSGFILPSSIFKMRLPCGFFYRHLPCTYALLPLNTNTISSLDSCLPLHFLDSLNILQACNGLLLCTNLPMDDPETNTKQIYYVCNPVMKRISTLPSPLPDSSSITIFGYNLAFDPSKSCHYRIICVHSLESCPDRYQIQIYSSENDAWRLSGSFSVFHLEISFSHGVFWNGAIHWITSTGEGLYFDVDNQSIGAIAALPPPRYWGKKRFRYCGESGGHLHFIETHGSGLQFKVFELARNGSYCSWRVRYRVDLDDVVAKYPEIMRGEHVDYGDPDDFDFNVLSIVEEDNEEESSLLLQVAGKIISYNFEDETSKEVADFGSDVYVRFVVAYQYFETFASV